LREVLGEHVTQKGSLVDPQKLRFDFSHFEAVTAEQLATIEQRVNEEIRANHGLQTQLMELDEAKASGAMALFGEKYDEKVRVVSMGPFSVELCGGTHVNATGDIGLFVITSESGIASGIRRIEAITGSAAIAYMQAASAQLKTSASLLKTDTDSVAEKIEALQGQQKAAEKALAKLKDQAASQQGADLLSNKSKIANVDVLVAKLEGVEAKALRPMVDDLKNRLGSGIIMLGVASGSKVSLIAGVTKDLTGRIKAGELVNFVAGQVGGKGGGRPDMAQAGGDQPDNLDSALNSVNEWLKDKL
jgi:alanyl-tRNA synthetase